MVYPDNGSKERSSGLNWVEQSSQNMGEENDGSGGESINFMWSLNTMTEPINSLFQCFPLLWKVYI